MHFVSPPEPNFYYFFLINKYGDKGSENDTHGPVPVIGPVPGTNNGFGNGFATSAVPNTTGTTAGLPDYGITDFVLYSNGQSQGRINLYHFTNSASSNVNNQPVLSIPTPPTPPLNPMLPENASVESAGVNQIQFDVDMSQLFPNLTGQARINAGKAVNFLQVNIVATNITPIDPNTNVIKEVDSMGNTLDTATAQSSFLQIDMRTNRTYTSKDNISSLNEPVGDVFPPGPNATTSLDLDSWTIEVQPGS